MAEVDANQPPGQLFDLTTNLGENRDLYKEHPEVVKRLTMLFEQIRHEQQSRR